ncbi:MAG: SEC59/DGK1/VTE5 family protein [Leptolyngbyaceae cyanobacterium MO_188.B28]|nr:SEC59/DGK1/VTE5 family protein [Leptolyngbyaceae cyanobacterium MO_188.B28]
MSPSVLTGIDVSPLSLRIAAVALWLGLIGLLAKFFQQKAGAGPEVVRKIVHMGVGNVILFAWWLNLPTWVGVTASSLFSAITLLSYRLPILPGLESVGRKSWGTFFYAVSIGVLIAWFWPQQRPQYAVIGILIMTWGDGLAALVGQNFGRHPYRAWGILKSWEGSSAMASASFLVCGLILCSVQGPIWQTWLVAFAVAIGATGLEALSKFGVDNLLAPIGSAALAFGLNEWLLAIGNAGQATSSFH